MKGLILAAGRGSRMGGLTADRPKCLLEIEGRSLLDRQVWALRTAGATEVGVVVGWRADLFDGAGLTVFVNERWAESTMVSSLTAAGRWLAEGPVLVSYGDIVYSPLTVARLAAVSDELAIAYDPEWRSLWDRRFAKPLEDAETFRVDGAGLVTDIGERPETADEVEGQYMGLLRFDPAQWAVVEKVLRTDGATRELDMTGLLRFLIRERGMRVRAVAAVGPWCEFDHPDDLVVGLEVLRILDREKTW